jgi:hypothetical protein
MKKQLLALGVGLLILAQAAPALAQGPKAWVFGWGNGHYENLDFKRRYGVVSKEAPNAPFMDIDWAPQDWLAQYQNELTLISEFYRADIIHDQIMRRKFLGLGREVVPVLQVGPNFYYLGNEDKIKVVETLDAVYQITPKDMFGLFVLQDAQTGRDIGTYTQYGLQLQ